MSKPVIQIKNLEKVYEGAVPVHAVNGINLTITEGEFTALKGPSGCGKTTLLNLLGGLDQPTSGTIEIGGVDITTLSENELIDFRLRNIGFVFQAYNLIPVLSAKENVSFIMLLQDRPKEEREARAQQLLVGARARALLRWGYRLPSLRWLRDRPPQCFDLALGGRSVIVVPRERGPGPGAVVVATGGSEAPF